MELSGRRQIPDPRERIRFPHVFRDPVHGDIRMTDFEWEILNTPEFQRLRGIKQLGFTNLVFAGAEHSRFLHSIGTMHVADRILRSIKDVSGWALAPEERLMARTFALVHDVTHVAYGHSIEDELAFFPRHDENHARISRLLLDSRVLRKVLTEKEETGLKILSKIA